MRIHGGRLHLSLFLMSSRVTAIQLESGSVAIPFANNIATFYSGCRLSTYSAIVIETFILTYYALFLIVFRLPETMWQSLTFTKQEQSQEVQIEENQVIHVFLVYSPTSGSKLLHLRKMSNTDRSSQTGMGIALFSH